MKYRLYIDETGNADLASSANANHRYLSLTGVIVELGYVDSTLFPAMELLKRSFFGSHADDPIVLHRKEIVNRLRPFDALRDPLIRQQFDAALLKLVADLDYRVLTVIIDKQLHLQRYSTWQYDPYHYCLMVMIERFVLWLKKRGVQGDVMAESRAGKEDMRLKESFRHVVAQGSDYIGAAIFQERLTSKELKVKAKGNNIAGLQLADMLAHPCFRSALSTRTGADPPDTYGQKMVEILKVAKYVKSPDGALDGWGVKWLP